MPKYNSNTRGDKTGGVMRFVSIFVFGAMVAIVACGTDSDEPSGTSGGSPGANEVWMQNTAFNPSTRTVTAGTTVTFTNQDGFVHTVTSSSVPSGATAFNSGNVSGNGTFQVTLTVAGTYQYFCSIHGTANSGMRATIVVN
ncbi:MAG: plastocyanin/azurin family copper-binding protein [Ignavibacteria bacterium]|nr:plastocyanin/azurin family copper-binding protein [Ignavibacteria bacterium]